MYFIVRRVFWNAFSQKFGNYVEIYNDNDNKWDAFAIILTLNYAKERQKKSYVERIFDASHLMYVP